jgi:phenylacetate-CoA ligase
MRRFFVNRIVIPALDTLGGTELSAHLKSLERSQWFSPEEIRALQNEKLRALVAHAYETVPLYREFMDEKKLTPHDIRTTDDLEKLPVIDKQVLKRNTPHKTVSDRYRVEDLLERHTSGSTGNPFLFYMSRQEKCLKRAEVARVWRWGGWDFGVRFVHLFSKPNSMFRTDGWLRGMESLVMARKFLSVAHLDPRYLDEIMAFRPRIIHGYGSAIYCLACFAKKRGICLNLKGVLTTADTLTKCYRKCIEKNFGTKVYDEYGGEDMSFMAQCEHSDLYHVNAENVFIEVLKDGRRVAPGETGEVVVTDLNRRSMPMIRYAMHDVVTTSARRCPCGRGLPTMEGIEGRQGDVLVAPSGRIISTSMLDIPFYCFQEIKIHQVIHREPGVVSINLVPDEGFGPHVIDRLAEKMHALIGDEFDLRFQVVDDVERTVTGKCRPVIVEVGRKDLAMHR